MGCGWVPCTLRTVSTARQMAAGPAGVGQWNPHPWDPWNRRRGGGLGVAEANRTISGAPAEWEGGRNRASSVMASVHIITHWRNRGVAHLPV